MNTIEKAHLIKELNELIHALDYRALSLFETAKYKQRIRDIFESCDEGYFKKQILQYRALTQPESAAHQFAKTTPYYFSYRGFFYQDTDLEQALYLLPESGWALLYAGKQGWQCWLIPAPNRTALISEWSQLADTYTWLEEQQDIYHCLHSDESLKAKAAILKESQALNVAKAKPVQTVAQVESETITPLENTTIALVSETVPIDENETDSLAAHLNLEIPAKLKWQQQALIWQDNPHVVHELQPYRFKDHPEWAEYCECCVQLFSNKEVTHEQIYIAEQLNSQGAFEKYMLFLGLNPEQVLHDIQNYSDLHNIQIASVKISTWHAGFKTLHDLSSLYTHYQELPETLWQTENYLPFIPNFFIHTQKFIHFDEAKATFETPLLLLKERGKLRLIHGQQRLQLSSHELAYPYLMLQREDGFSWQHIKQVISTLAHPLDVYTLHQALLDSLNEDVALL